MLPGAGDHCGACEDCLNGRECFAEMPGRWKFKMSAIPARWKPSTAGWSTEPPRPAAPQAAVSIEAPVQADEAPPAEISHSPSPPPQVASPQRSPVQAVETPPRLAEVSAPPPPSSPDSSIGAELAAVLELAEGSLRTIRKTPDGLPSVIDVISTLTGLNARDAARALRVLLERYPHLEHQMLLFKFAGRGRHKSQVSQLATLLEVMMLLPGARAAKVRHQAARLMIRYLGGDLTLIQEVEKMQHIQAQLANEDPSHPLRACGVAVEAESNLLKPLCIHEKPEGLDAPAKQADLYIMHVASAPPALKIGRSDDPLQRGADLTAAKQGLILGEGASSAIQSHPERPPLPQKNLLGRHTVQVIFRGCGMLERRIQGEFAAIKIDGTLEYFNIGLQDTISQMVAAILRIVPEAIEKQRKEKRDAAAICQSSEDVEEERALKRRRHEIELAALDDQAELDRQSRRATAEQQAEFDRQLRKAKIDIELAALAHKAKLEHQLREARAAADLAKLA